MNALEQDEQIRLQYLQAMGVDVWQLREPDSVASLESVSPIEQAEINTESSDESLIDEWSQLHREVSVCQHCQLCESRTQTVFGSGNQQADWMLIGEAPGQNEDREGLPFVGKAGQLLTEMIRALGLRREQVYIANVLKCRPPANRDPQANEVAACADYLHRQIELVKPKIILAVGRIAAQNLLKTQEPLARLRGVVHHLEDRPLIVIYHPAYLLRSLLEKRKAWQDLQFAIRTYNHLEN
jgi:uracil-DNA glycosylase